MGSRGPMSCVSSRPAIRARVRARASCDLGDQGRGRGGGHGVTSVETWQLVQRPDGRKCGPPTEPRPRIHRPERTADSHAHASSQNTMHIRLITPAPPRSRAGNRATAARWAAILRALGPPGSDLGGLSGRARGPDGRPARLAQCGGHRPLRRRPTRERPLVVALTGTDAYRFIHSHPEHDAALHRPGPSPGGSARPDRRDGPARAPGQGPGDLPVGPAHQSPASRPSEVSWSASPGTCARRRTRCDRPWRCATCRPGVGCGCDHYGAAHTPDWAAAAQRGDGGEPPLPLARRGPPAPVAAGLPACPPAGAAVADGGRGQRHLRGGGRRAAGDRLADRRLRRPAGPRLSRLLSGGGRRRALRDLLLRAESDPDFYRSLEAACAGRRHLFTPEGERAAWAALLDEL